MRHVPYIWEKEKKICVKNPEQKKTQRHRERKD